MTVTEALEWGEKHAKDADLGEHPAGSNKTPVWQQYHQITGAQAFQGQPWCGAMLIDLVEHSHSWHAPANWIGVYAIQSWGEAHDRFRRGTKGIKPGDVLIIGGPGEHTGMARDAVRADGSVPTIEGNTSPGSRGSQFNGGTVALKVRKRSEVYGYVAINDLLGGGPAPTRKATSVSRVAQPQYRLEGPTGAVHLWEHGPRIEAMQRRLGVPADGYFGPQTQRAAAAMKVSHGISGDGSTVGADALEEISHLTSPAQAFRTLRPGDKGGVVRMLQRLLNDHGAHLDVDGDFGPETKTAVNRIKAQRGATQDGVAGQRVWRLLTGG